MQTFAGDLAFVVDGMGAENFPGGIARDQTVEVAKDAAIANHGILSRGSQMGDRSRADEDGMVIDLTGPDLSNFVKKALAGAAVLHDQNVLMVIVFNKHDGVIANRHSVGD